MNNIKEEPAQCGGCTSSGENKENNQKNRYQYDSTETLICQALKIGAVAAETGATAEYKDGVFVINPGRGAN